MNKCIAGNWLNASRRMLDQVLNQERTMALMGYVLLSATAGYIGIDGPTGYTVEHCAMKSTRVWLVRLTSKCSNV